MAGHGGEKTFLIQSGLNLQRLVQRVKVEVNGGKVSRSRAQTALSTGPEPLRRRYRHAPHMRKRRGRCYVKNVPRYA
jgi:hypothetical protein